MKKLLTATLSFLFLITPCYPLHAGLNIRALFDFNFKDTEILPYIGAGLAAAGGIALATWLLSESDQDVINAAYRELETVNRTFSDLLYVFERYPYNPHAQDDHLKALIGQLYSHERFYFITCRTALSNAQSRLKRHAQKVQRRIQTVENKLHSLSHFDQRYEIARTTRKQLVHLHSSLQNTTNLLTTLYKRIGSWHEYAQQHRKYQKHLKRLERERRERDRELRLQQQQWEIQRLQGRVKQLECETHSSRCQRCDESHCVHVEFGW